MIIPRNDMHLVLGAHLFSPEHVTCTFVLIINRIVGIVATLYMNMFYHPISVIIDICHLIDNLFRGSLFLLFSDFLMNFSTLDK